MRWVLRSDDGGAASPELFAGMAAVYARLSATPLAALTPEEARDLTDLEAVLARLEPGRPQL